MDGNRKTHKGSHTSREDGGPPDDQEEQEQASSDIISMEHLRRLVRLLDQSDVSELELKRPEDGTRLVLRKVKAAKVNRQPDGSMPMLQADRCCEFWTTEQLQGRAAQASTMSESTWGLHDTERCLEPFHTALIIHVKEDFRADRPTTKHAACEGANTRDG